MASRSVVRPGEAWRSVAWRSKAGSRRVGGSAAERVVGHNRDSSARPIRACPAPLAADAAPTRTLFPMPANLLTAFCCADDAHTSCSSRVRASAPQRLSASCTPAQREKLKVFQQCEITSVRPGGRGKKESRRERTQPETIGLGPGTAGTHMSHVMTGSTLLAECFFVHAT